MTPSLLAIFSFVFFASYQAAALTNPPMRQYVSINQRGSRSRGVVHTVLQKKPRGIVSGSVKCAGSCDNEDSTDYSIGEKAISYSPEMLTPETPSKTRGTFRNFSELQCLAAFWVLNIIIFAVMVATRNAGRNGTPCFPLLRQILAGGVAAALAETVFYPTEVIKVRMQLAHTAKGNQGVIRTARSVFQERGLGGLWAAGIVAGCMRGLFYQGIRLGLFPPIRKSLYFAISDRGRAFPGDTLSTDSVSAAGLSMGLAGKVLAGTITGMLGAGICSPFDLAKVLMTAEGVKSKDNRNDSTEHENGSINQSYVNSLDALFTVARLEGIWNGLWRASGVSMIRAGVASGVQLATYDHTKAALGAVSGLGKQNPVVHLGASLFAALAYTTTSAPLDLIKSRVMAQGTVPEKSCRKGAYATARDILYTEGIGSFWRGWWPATIRLVPIVILVFPLMEQLRLLLGVDSF